VVLLPPYREHLAQMPGPICALASRLPSTRSRKFDAPSAAHFRQSRQNTDHSGTSHKGALSPPSSRRYSAANDMPASAVSTTEMSPAVRPAFSMIAVNVVRIIGGSDRMVQES
jgi:hypothetical protein